jgi:peroxiredoxin
MARIKVGSKVPAGKLQRMTRDGPSQLSTSELFKGKKVALFSVPGAFTPTCSRAHLPGFVKQARALKAKGIDEIVCVAVNDAFVMDAWGKAHRAAGKVTMLADGNGDFTRKLGLGADYSKYGMGKRGRRFSMVVENGVVTRLNVEPGGGLKVSDAETMLSQL